MAERRILYIIVCFFVLQGSTKGFEVEGNDGDKIIQLFMQKQCLTILATDLETYKGKFFIWISHSNGFIFSHSVHLSGIGASTVRLKNVQELSQARKHRLFSSILASSSCVIGIIETYVHDEILDTIDMMNGLRADRKHLLLLAPTFHETMFRNITINYAVTIEHSDGGEVNNNDFDNMYKSVDVFTPQMKLSFNLYVLHWERCMHWFSRVCAQFIYKTLWEER